MRIPAAAGALPRGCPPWTRCLLRMAPIGRVAAVARRALVVGSGGREHALVRALGASGWTVFAAPGNPGIAADADVRDIPMNDHGALRVCL